MSSSLNVDAILIKKLICMLIKLLSQTDRREKPTFALMLLRKRNM